MFGKLGDFIDLDPDPDYFVNPDPDTINPDPHHWLERQVSRNTKIDRQKRRQMDRNIFPCSENKKQDRHIEKIRRIQQIFIQINSYINQLNFQKKYIYTYFKYKVQIFRYISVHVNMRRYSNRQILVKISFITNWSEKINQSFLMRFKADTQKNVYMYFKNTTNMTRNTIKKAQKYN